MAAGTLYTYPQSFRANKALIAAGFSGADVKVDNNFKLGETNQSSNFLKKFPLGKVPAFEGKDGFCLTESNAIAFYVANAQLKGADVKQQALVQQWINFSDNEILPAACTWTFPCLGITQFNKQDTERAKQQIQKALTVLNDHLLTRTYIVGERVTLADISLVCDMQSLYELVLDPAFRKQYGNVNRWFNTLINQPQFKKVLGNVKLTDSMATFDAKKYQELHTGGAGDKKKEKSHEASKEKVPAKEKAPPKAEPEDEQPPAPKRSDPLAALPKGTMDLDLFKRTYSNEDTETVAIPHFWEHFDPEAYSIWHCDYLYSDEVPMVFMACNLVSGMFQRIEKLHKYAFASVCIFGENKNVHIAGIWFWKGQENVFSLNEDWNIDAPSYKWTKLDPKSEKTKTMVNEYFLHEGKFDGRTFNQGKIFK